MAHSQATFLVEIDGRGEGLRRDPIIPKLLNNDHEEGRLGMSHVAFSTILDSQSRRGSSRIPSFTSRDSSNSAWTSASTAL
jgi:hypothetical protein